MLRTVRNSSVAQSVRNAAHYPLPNSPPQVVQSDADATCFHPRVVATATSRNAAAKRKTSSGVRDQENSMESGAEVTLGLQVVVSENGVRKTYRARYYNPATGRFLSRDPEEGKIKIPATLHKYLYAGGDPVNRIDPRGRADTADYSSLLANESWKTQLELRATAYVIRKVIECVTLILYDIDFGFTAGIDAAFDYCIANSWG
jgi:RHS repeat-associated protein